MFGNQNNLERQNPTTECNQSFLNENAYSGDESSVKVLQCTLDIATGLRHGGCGRGLYPRSQYPMGTVFEYPSTTFVYTKTKYFTKESLNSSPLPLVAKS